MINRLVPPSTIERYFSLHYAPGLARQLAPRTTKPLNYGEDVCIARHHNGICVLCLSPKHPIVVQKKMIDAVDYRVEMRQVKGKRKKGGIVVEQKTRLCIITCNGDEKYSVLCGIKGSLLEYNDGLQTDRSLINDSPLTDGYLAVIMPWLSQIKTAVDDLMPASEYEAKSAAGL